MQRPGMARQERDRRVGDLPDPLHRSVPSTLPRARKLLLCSLHLRKCLRSCRRGGTDFGFLSLARDPEGVICWRGGQREIMMVGETWEGTWGMDYRRWRLRLGEWLPNFGV